MARPKKSETNTTSVVEEEKATEVEKTETPVETETKEVVEESKSAEKEDKTVEEKPIDDNAKVVIKCAAYAGKSIVLPTRTIQLDEKGCCEFSGIEAKRLLSIPGYELSK